MPKRDKILIVDDDRSIRELLEILLKNEGLTVISAAGAEKGLAEAKATEFDVIISDLKMTNMSGIDFLRELRETGLIRRRRGEVGTQFILLTAHAEADAAVQALKMGAFDYILKLQNWTEELKFIVHSALENRRLREEDTYLKREFKKVHGMGNLIGKSKNMQELFKMIEVVSATNSTVLITGESGTGKELVAKAIHLNSPRDQFLSGPAFTGNEHRAVCGADDFDHLEELLHFLALPDEIAHPVHLLELALEIGVFLPQPAVLESVMNDEFQLFRPILILQDVIEGTHLQRLNRRFGLSVCGKQDKLGSYFSPAAAYKSSFEKFTEELDSGHVGHLEVGNDDVEFRGLCFGETLFRPRGADDGKTFVLQEDFEQLPNRTVIIDYQNLVAFRHLQINHEGCSHPFAGTDSNGAVMCTDDLIHDRQPKTGPVSKRRMERNEEFLEFIFRQADTGVFESDVSIPVVGITRNCQSSHIRHGFECVGSEIIKHLAHHAFVDLRLDAHQRCLDPMRRLQLRTISHPFHRFRNQLRQINRSPVWRSRTRVAEKLCDDTIEPLGFTVNNFCELALIGIKTQIRPQ